MISRNRRKPYPRQPGEYVPIVKVIKKRQQGVTRDVRLYKTLSKNGFNKSPVDSSGYILIRPGKREPDADPKQTPWIIEMRWPESMHPQLRRGLKIYGASSGYGITRCMRLAKRLLYYTSLCIKYNVPFEDYEDLYKRCRVK